MKKILFYSFILLNTLTMALFGQTSLDSDTQISYNEQSILESDLQVSTDLLPATDGFIEIECSIEPIDPSGPLYHKHQKRHQGRPIPHIGLKQGTSLNWCGYVAATNLQFPTPGSVSAVSGLWTVPTLSPSTSSTYSAAWVGIDGYSNGTVEQIGTSHDWINGAQQNYAWFEMYPNSLFELVGFPVNNNDLIGAIVEYRANGVFLMKIFNYSRGVSTTVPISYTVSTVAQRSSAEWIVEPPSTQQGILPLAHFNVIYFQSCFVKINGIVGTIGTPYWRYDPLFMRSQAGIYKAIPSSLSNNGSSFFVVWKHE